MKNRKEKAEIDYFWLRKNEGDFIRNPETYEVGFSFKAPKDLTLKEVLDAVTSFVEKVKEEIPQADEVDLSDLLSNIKKKWQKSHDQWRENNDFLDRH